MNIGNTHYAYLSVVLKLTELLTKELTKQNGKPE